MNMRNRGCSPSTSISLHLRENTVQPEPPPCPLGTGRSGDPGQLPLDLFAHLVVAKPVSQHQRCHGRTQRLDVLLGVLPVEIKLLRQPLRWISEECFYACVTIVMQHEK